MLLVEYFIRNRRAFALFSDSSLSGGLPYDEPALIAEMREHKAGMYSKVFKAVFMSQPDRESPENWAGMKKYLDAYTQKVLNGGYKEAADLETGETVTKGKNRNPILTRPGLTAIVQSLDTIRAIVVTDLSRLSRSEILLADLLKRMRKKNVVLVGIYQELDELNKPDEIAGAVITVILSYMAARTRFDVLLGVLRGIKQKLLNHKHHAKAPLWIRRKGGEKDGVAELIPERAALVRQMIVWYLDDKNVDDPEKSYSYVTRKLNESGAKSRYGVHWTDNVVRDILNNPALIGFQVIFGKRWKVYPELIDTATWLKLRKKIERRQKHYVRKHKDRNIEDHLMSGLLKCSCGYNLVAKKGQSGNWYYVCNRPEALRGDNGDGNRHVNLRCDRVDGFFDTLMQGHSETVFKRFAANSDGAELMAELRRLEEGALEKERERQNKRDEQKGKTKQNVRKTYPQIDPDDPAFDQIVDLTVKALTKQLDAEKEEEDNRIMGVNARIDELRNKEELQKLQQVVKSWPDLSLRQRNRTLKAIFQQFDFRPVPGYDDAHLIPVFRLPKQPDVPPIIVEYKQWGSGASYKLMSPADWLYQWYRMENIEDIVGPEPEVEIIPWEDAT